jgi:hypothetical protein
MGGEYCSFGPIYEATVFQENIFRIKGRNYIMRPQIIQKKPCYSIETDHQTDIVENKLVIDCDEKSGSYKRTGHVYATMVEGTKSYPFKYSYYVFDKFAIIQNQLTHHLVQGKENPILVEVPGFEQTRVLVRCTGGRILKTERNIYYVLPNSDKVEIRVYLKIKNEEKELVAKDVFTVVSD